VSAKDEDLVLLRVRRSDISVLLDALEGAFFDFDIMENCADTSCSNCSAKKETLSRLRENLLARAPIWPKL
jgi:hypothetical protein